MKRSAKFTTSSAFTRTRSTRRRQKQRPAAATARMFTPAVVARVRRGRAFLSILADLTSRVFRAVLVPRAAAASQVLAAAVPVSADRSRTSSAVCSAADVRQVRKGQSREPIWNIRCRWTSGRRCAAARHAWRSRGRSSAAPAGARARWVLHTAVRSATAPARCSR